MFIANHNTTSNLFTTFHTSITSKNRIEGVVFILYIDHELAGIRYFNNLGIYWLFEYILLIAMSLDEMGYVITLHNHVIYL